MPSGSRPHLVDPKEVIETGTAGFVLAGGRSTRMGRDKALLEIGGRTLVERVAGEVLDAAGSVAIIADPSRYAHLGFEVIPDLVAGRGPLGGLATALDHSGQPWNLVVAVDMPDLGAEFLRWLIAEAHNSAAPVECVAPAGETGPEPLCAVYHRRSLPKVLAAMDENRLKMRSLLEILETRTVVSPAGVRFRNINTPEDWAAHG